MKLNQNKILDYANHLNLLAHALAGGGECTSYLALCQTYESHSKKPHYFYESLDCFDFLQKSRNDKVSGIVIARALSEAIHTIKSFCFVLLSQKVESPYHLDSNLQSEIPPIRSCIIYFSHYLKSFALDTSLRINATLSMTRWGADSRILDCFVRQVALAMTNRHHAVILSLYKRRSIHFSDLKSKAIRGLYTNLKAIRHRFKRFATPHTTFKGIQMQT